MLFINLVKIIFYCLNYNGTSIPNFSPPPPESGDRLNIHLLKAVAIIVSRDVYAINGLLNAIAITVSLDLWSNLFFFVVSLLLREITSYGIKQAFLLARTNLLVSIILFLFF